MGLTAYAAGWFLVAALPIAIWVAWNDMRVMKIPNVANYALVASYAILGLIALPFDQYLWQWLHLVVALAVGLLLWMTRQMGGGDVKFLAAAAPMVAYADLNTLILIAAPTFLAGFVTHRIAKHTALRRMVPEWESWDPPAGKKKFPMGLPFGMNLVFYLIFVLVTR